MVKIIITLALIIIIFWIIHFIRRVSLACKPKENAGATGMRK